MAAEIQSCRTLADLFDGDGRKKVWPGDHMADAYAAVYDCKPMPVTRGQARMVRDQLERFGISNHSANGNVLWVALEICRRAGYSYKVTVHRLDGKITGYAVNLHVDKG